MVSFQWKAESLNIVFIFQYVKQLYRGRREVERDGTADPGNFGNEEKPLG